MFVNNISQDFVVCFKFVTKSFLDGTTVSSGGEIITWKDDAGTEHNEFRTNSAGECSAKFRCHRQDLYTANGIQKT